MENQAETHETLISTTHGSEALHHAKVAAELYFKAADQAGPGPERSRLRLKCKEMLAIAESLQSECVGPSVSTKLPLRQKSKTLIQSSRHLSARERAILIHASGLHGNKFIPWDKPPLDSSFELGSDTNEFIDTTKFSLSPSQLETMVGWRRPYDIFKRKLGSNALHSVNMKVDENVDLAQDITTDCSVVASLCSALKHMAPGKDSLLNGMIYPFDIETGVPKASENGKYIFRFYFNGCHRQVVIDDRLPSTNGDRALFVVDLENPTSIWPALIEKAYLKVRGGYDFPGSNSCTDLWIITGWIPEQIFLQKEDLNLDQIWNTIVLGFKTRTVIMTLGTGRISHSEEEATGLVSEHDYGVIELEDLPNSRRLLIKNPWCVGPAWASINGTSLASTTDALQVGSRTFWVTLEYMAQNFESMYLNWNPNLFKFRQDHHFMWNVATEHNMSDTVFSNPQYRISSSKKTSAWIVLDRHHRDEELQLARDRSPSRSDSGLGYMSLAVVEDGHRIFKLPTIRSDSDFVDSNQTLAKVTLMPDRKYTVVPLHDKLPLPSYSFTLSFLTMSLIEVTSAPNKRTHLYRQDASWGRRTAGGNSSFPSYGISPQYQFTLKRATKMSLLLASDAPDIPIHIDVVWTRSGERAQFPLPRRVVVADSKEYVRRSAVVEDAYIDAGTYSVVCSTFQPNQYGDFSLLVGSDEEIILSAIPTANAGRLPESLPLLVFPEGVGRARISINSQRLAHINVMMQAAPDALSRSGSSSTSSFRLSVCYGWGSSQVDVAVSGNGDFEEPKAVLSTPEFDLEPTRAIQHGLWVVVERIGGRSSSETVQVQLFSDRILTAGTWDMRD